MTSYCARHNVMYFHACPCCTKQRLAGAVSYCVPHDLYIPAGTPCPRCATAEKAPDATALRLNVLSQTIDHLLARQTEQDERIAMLRRQVRALQHGRIASQRANNHLATAHEQLEEAHNSLVGYVETIEDRP